MSVSVGQVYRAHPDSERARRLGVREYAVRFVRQDGRVLCEDLSSGGNCSPIFTTDELADPQLFESVRELEAEGAT